MSATGADPHRPVRCHAVEHRRGLLEPNRAEAIAGMPMLLRTHLPHRDFRTLVQRAVSGACEGVVHITRGHHAPRRRQEIINKRPSRPRLGQAHPDRQPQFPGSHCWNETAAAWCKKHHGVMMLAAARGRHTIVVDTSGPTGGRGDGRHSGAGRRLLRQAVTQCHAGVPRRHASANIHLNSTRGTHQPSLCTGLPVSHGIAIGHVHLVSHALLRSQSLPSAAAPRLKEPSAFASQSTPCAASLRLKATTGGGVMPRSAPLSTCA